MLVFLQRIIILCKNYMQCDLNYRNYKIKHWKRRKYLTICMINRIIFNLTIVNIFRKCAKSFCFEDAVIANLINHIVVNLYRIRFFTKRRNLRVQNIILRISSTINLNVQINFTTLITLFICYIRCSVRVRYVSRFHDNYF